MISQQMWLCPNCREAIEPHFRRCWNCGSDDLGNLDPTFRTDAATDGIGAKPRGSRSISFAWMLLAICTFIAIMATAISVELLLPERWNLRLSLTIGLFLVCLLTGVAINVASRLYLWLREYLYSNEPRLDSPETKQLVRISDSNKQDPN